MEADTAINLPICKQFYRFTINTSKIGVQLYHLRCGIAITGLCSGCSL